MTQETTLSCQCGQVHLTVREAPITVAECYCTSYAAARARIESLPGAPPVVGAHGSTHFVLYRKDRLANFRLSPERSTRRVIATCCNTPVLLEFKGGHWASLYGNLWHGQALPAANLRTVTGDRAGGVPDAEVPSGGWPTTQFFARLLGAWIAMGFKVPVLALDTREIPPPGPVLS